MPLSAPPYNSASQEGAGVIGRKPKSFFSPRDPGAVRTRFRRVLARAERRMERELRQMTKSKPVDSMIRLTLRPNRSA
jgi:hypothetical protein